MRLLTWVSFWAFLADQLSKYLVVHVMDLERTSPIEVFPPLLRFVMGRNYGINFGLFSNQGEMMRWVLIGLALLICALVIYWMRSETSRWSFISAGLLIGGALGNVVDRILYGYVLDFLNMSCCGIRNPYTFNVADIAIFAGAIGLVIFTGEKKPDETKTP